MALEQVRKVSLFNSVDCNRVLLGRDFLLAIEDGAYKAMYISLARDFAVVHCFDKPQGALKQVTFIGSAQEVR